MFPDDSENEIDVEEGASEDGIKDDDLYYDKEECTMQEYEIMKDNLLLYNHARLISQDKHSKDYLVSIMFSHYDQNNNGNLEADELNEVRDLCKNTSLRLHYLHVPHLHIFKLY